MLISVVLPAYKEAENLKNILPKLHRELEPLEGEYEILVIDTMEPLDETRAVCQTLKAEYITRKGGNYYGDAIRTGFEKAEGKYVVIMDADGSHNPADIMRFYDEMKKEEWDLIIGSRYMEGGYIDNNFILRAMSRILNIAYRIAFRIKVKDISDSFRMYQGSKVKTLDLECDNFDVVEEILIKLNIKYPNFRTKEIPISFNKREYGESKRDLKKFVLSYLKTMHRLLEIKRKAKRNV